MKEVEDISKSFRLAAVSMREAAENTCQALRLFTDACSRAFAASATYNGITNSKHKPRQVRMRGK